MPILDRRNFLKLLEALGIGSAFEPAYALAGEPGPGLVSGTYHPGRIDNEYSLLLPGERGALQEPPAVSAVGDVQLTARRGGQSIRMSLNDQFDGWRLLTTTDVNGVQTAVFEKHVTHRGAIAFVTEHNGVTAYIPKQIGQLSNIRPRQTNTPHGIKLERTMKAGPDTAGEYILNSAEDPCYENMAALGPEYMGWTLVANEEAGPQHSLYLEASGRSRERKLDSGLHGLWAPDAADSVFDPLYLLFSVPAEGFSSKRTLLGGYLPVADLAVWDSTQQTGYEAIVLLPLGEDAKPMARLRSTATPETVRLIGQLRKDAPETVAGIAIFNEDGQVYTERYWNSSPRDFYRTLATIWSKWHAFHEQAMQVDIPDEWLLNAARAGLTLTRCSYRGLEPTYQVGEGAYTNFRALPDCKVRPGCKESANDPALFPVAHSEFIWAHQLWNHGDDADRYFQFYLDHYILPNGDFLFNTQTQVEAPLNAGVFLANSARSYLYGRNLPAFEKRLPTLERMIDYVLDRYNYSKATFATGDRRRGLIWGSPEADLGDPKKDTPQAHPFFYQNAVGVWRGLHQHAKALRQAAKDSQRQDLDAAASRYQSISREMRAEIQTSLAATLAAGNSEMRSTGITPFTPDDVHRQPSDLENYENHRFMEDWFLADWGDRALDLGHLKHRQLAGKQILGLGTGWAPSNTSNFMAHGTLSVLIRQNDYRPFLLSLYALACYAADSGNRYSPEDAYLPGGHPLEGPSPLWSAVVNSTLQPTLGLRWLLCYEESDADVCHLQKAAPKHWFAQEQTIVVMNCPTRFGSISWSTHSITNEKWRVTVDVPKRFSADLVIHIHPSDGRLIRSTSAGVLEGDKIILPQASFSGATHLQILVS